MDKKNVSMNDVAIAAGVSLKTVSRVINEPDSVRESTRDLSLIHISEPTRH